MINLPVVIIYNYQLFDHICDELEELLINPEIYIFWLIYVIHT